MKNQLQTILFFMSIFSALHAQEWTWFYKKIFSPEECLQRESKHQLMFAKTDVSPFTQLVFTWNAVRPAKGFFVFYIQARDQNGVWSPWFKMFDWGQTVQKSYQEHNGNFSYVHVRLEMLHTHKANAFRVKVMSEDGADLCLLKTLAVSVSDMTQFQEETETKSYYALPSVTIKNVPRISQKILDHPKADVICSPTSTTMLVSFLANKSVDPIAFSENVFDAGLHVYGSWPFNMAHAFEVCNGEYFFSTRRLKSFNELYRYLNSGMPVVVSVRGSLPGAAKVMPHGHLLVVVGWDQATGSVVCNDPAFETHKATRKKYKLENFLRAWERSNRLAYIAEPIG